MANTGGSDMITRRTFLLLLVACLLLTSNFVDANKDKEKKDKDNKEKGKDLKSQDDSSDNNHSGKDKGKDGEKSQEDSNKEKGKKGEKSQEDSDKKDMGKNDKNKGHDSDNKDNGKNDKNNGDGSPTPSVDGSPSSSGGSPAPPTDGSPSSGGGSPAPSADGSPAPSATGGPSVSGGSGDSGAVYDVTKFGAKADGKSSNELSFTKAWRAACDSSGNAKLLIPPGQYVAGEIVFQGPCAGQKSMTIEIQGTLLAQTDPSAYPGKAWISIERVKNVLVTGGGTINGRGKSMWQYAGGDSPLPTSLQFQTVGNSKITGMNFVDSMGVHVKVSDCVDIEVQGLKITAPDESPNTDGIHTSNTTNLKILDSIIGTGDDCVALGQGSTNILVSKITCGPGHGISVGSLGKRPDELNVKGILVSDCTLKGTDNGARIKTWHGSKVMEATNIVYENIIMEGVQNPILIDQHYQSKNKPEQSRVKLSDIHFRNIKGTTVSPVPVQLLCSSAVPCQGVELADINLQGTGKASSLTSECANAQASVKGSFSVSPLKCSG